jgi:hypothetical protein
MRTLRTFVAAVGSVALLATVAHAQSVKKSTLSGVLTSASATAPLAGTPQTVLTTPATGFFILTQACATTPGVGQTTFTAGALGTIVTSTNDECTVFTNGVAIPVSTAIQCTSGTGSNENCMVTGVLSSK